jgi:phosphate transport system permease protein
MVVLLCAGNRIAIPDFTLGLSVFTDPVHTMTGIIAQEMGEVVHGSIHYRALFVVGLVLFVLSLAINYIAQKIVRRYRISIG